MKNHTESVAAPAAPEHATIKNPLLESVEEKGYSQPNVKVDPAQLQQPIPEPQFIAPNIDAEKDIFEEEDNQEGTQQKAAGSGKPSTPEFNQTLNELSPKDQERSAEHAANMIFAGYQKLHDAGNWWISISDDQLIKLQMDGELDTSVSIPYTSQDWMPLMDFIKTYNDQAKEFFKIDPEWRAQVEPALIRVLKKYKIGMTDEQFLAAKFAEDIGVKLIQGRLMRATCKSIIEFAKEESRANRQQQQPSPLTSVPGGQAAQQQPIHSESGQAPLSAVPGGQAPYQGPMDTQDHVRSELGTQAGAAAGAGVEHSAPPQFGDAKMLKNLSKVARKRGVKNAKSGRKNKSVA
jgi:hypothetical protein